VSPDPGAPPGSHPYSASAILRTAAALPPIERMYATARFLVLRARLLAVMDGLLPATGSILDVGCGFGLFSSYFSQTRPGRRITGVDLSPRRVAMARRVAERLDLPARFVVGDAREAPISGPFDAAYVLDVLHHLPREAQAPLLRRLAGLLTPGGLLLIKDITTSPRSGLLFTEALDRLMVGLDAPLAYRHHDEWRTMLEEIGFRVAITRVPDVLPYPHVVLSARLPG
jgi:SAM-dependent methyltransferase